jgi:hypothetical protein
MVYIIHTRDNGQSKVKLIIQLQIHWNGIVSLNCVTDYHLTYSLVVFLYIWTYQKLYSIIYNLLAVLMQIVFTNVLYYNIPPASRLHIIACESNF